MNLKIYKTDCPKCKNPMWYSSIYTANKVRKSGKICNECKRKERLENQIRICPICGKTVKYTSRSGFHSSETKNSPCRPCNNRNSPWRKERIKWWTNVVGNIVFTGLSTRRKTMIRKYWKSASDKQKTKILSKTDLQKKYFWDHLNRAKAYIQKKNRPIHLENLRRAFDKYRGNNHWMKRPEVIGKVIKSCEKYKGSGHWFNRPDSYAKLLKTYSKKYKGFGDTFRKIKLK